MYPKKGQNTCSFIALNKVHGLSASTHHSVAHRDLKLENWLYQDTSSKSKLKLIDFGFSRMLKLPNEPFRKVLRMNDSAFSDVSQHSENWDLPFSDAFWHSEYEVRIRDMRMPKFLQCVFAFCVGKLAFQNGFSHSGMAFWHSGRANSSIPAMRSGILR